MKSYFHRVMIMELAFLLSSCASSLVYSPTLNLPPAPLKANEFQLSGNLLYLPETRPHRTSSETAFGYDGLIRYGISNRFSVHAKGWRTFEALDGDLRSGFAIGTLMRLSEDSKSWQYGVLGQGGFVLAGSSVEGGGGSITGLVWLPSIYKIKPNAALGFILGKRNANSNSSDQY